MFMHSCPFPQIQIGINVAFLIAWRQRDLFDAELRPAQIRRHELLALVRLYALGGGGQ